MDTHIYCYIINVNLGTYYDDHYTANSRAPKYINQVLTDIKGDIHSNTIIVEVFTTPLT